MESIRIYVVHITVLTVALGSMNQEPGSLIADIGCGNGKYLHINSQTYKLGCDYCFPLVESARNDGHEVMVCHSLCLPYRNECFDAVLSIAGREGQRP
ncbi:unnamed protein product [Caretta caretta]